MAETFIWNLNSEYYIVSNDNRNKILADSELVNTELSISEWLNDPKFGRRSVQQIEYTIDQDDSDELLRF